MRCDCLSSSKVRVAAERRVLRDRAVAAAVSEYLDGTPGRLMRSLKSLLSSSLMHETVSMAGLAPVDISTLYFTGGSSGMTVLREAFGAAFPPSRIVVGDLFGSVVSGLGIDAGRRFA